jgi:Zinc-ribbon, C4HC2 type
MDSSKIVAARWTQLPPSPDISPSLAMSGLQPSGMTLGESQNRKSPVHNPIASSRLRSVASYGKFHPQTIACSPPIYQLDSPSHHSFGSEDLSSLGAVWGDGGIALFRTSRPDAPLLVLSQPPNIGSSNTNCVQNLSFDTNLSNSVLLAASRGNSLFIWDASGHSLSPLLGRLSLDVIDKHDICSIAWKVTDSTHSMILTTTSTYTCLWDLRVSLGARASKPSIRFGSSSLSSQLNQVACSHREECATMDTSGMVCIHDLRMLGGSKPRVTASFQSFNYVGVGLASFQTSTNESCWLTWGLDNQNTDPLVRIWSTTQNNVAAYQENADNYWHMDGSQSRLPTDQISECASARNPGILVGQSSIAQLACARMCPDPFKDYFVTVAVGTDESRFWKADLWKITSNNDAHSRSTDVFGMEKVLSFTEDRSFDNTIVSPFGSLSGAELAISQSPLKATHLHGRDASPGEPTLELLLCCISQEGLITTNVVTDSACMDKNNIREEEGSFIPIESKRPLLSSRYLKYIPNERRGKSMSDAAAATKTLSESDQTKMVSGENGQPFLNRISSLALTKSNEKTLDDDSMKISSNARGDGNDLPFDMDVVPIEHVTFPPLQATGVKTDEEEGIELSQPRMSKRLYPESIPCPRLCGATFSFGRGGLIGFTNGETNKMWTWFLNHETRRKNPGPKSSNAVSEKMRYPRTKKDLDDMIEAAKIAQWEEDHENQADSESESDDSVEDPLDDLSSDEDGEQDSSSLGHEESVTKDIFQDFIGARHITNLQSSASRINSSDNDEISNLKSSKEDVSLITSNIAPQRLHQILSFDAPTSDVLTPVVCLWYDNKGMMFGGQTVDLAMQLLLGDWSIVSELRNMDKLISTVADVFDKGIESSESSISLNSSRGDVLRDSIISERMVARKKSHALLGSHHVEPSLQQRLALPYFRPSRHLDDDEPVHGGEYTVRPSREESMLILRKLLPKPYQSLISPPDSHLLPNKFEPKFSLLIPAPQSSEGTLRTAVEIFKLHLLLIIIFASGTKSPTIKIKPFESDKKSEIGVFTMPTQRISSLKTTSDSFLQSICLYNAKICRDFNQHQKADTWSIIARAVENHLLDEGCNDSFSGWDGAEIGRELVASLLKYYEIEGDVQMVATVVCVLNSGKSANDGPKNASLLTTDQSQKYALYIQRYADLVFRWGLFTKRAELLKFLPRRFNCGVEEELSSSFISKKEATVNNEILDRHHYGISFGGTCHRCDCPVSTSDNNICPRCRAYAFRCILCDNAIRGLFTICALCGHGGHFNHITSWFQRHKQCPTGCGCECIHAASCTMVTLESSRLITYYDVDSPN